MIYSPAALLFLAHDRRADKALLGIDQSGKMKQKGRKRREDKIRSRDTVFNEVEDGSTHEWVSSLNVLIGAILLCWTIQNVVFSSCLNEILQRFCRLRRRRWILKIKQER